MPKTAPPESVAQKSDRELDRLLGHQARKLGKKRPRKKLLSANNRWQEWELELLGKHPDSEIARLTGRPLRTIAGYRRKHGVQMFNSPMRLWEPWEKELVGTITDPEFAARTGRNLRSVRNMRHFLGKEPFGGRLKKPWKRRELKLLGKLPDAEIARRTGRTVVAVESMRIRLDRLKGIPPRTTGQNQCWTEEEDQWLAEFGNAEVMRLTKRSLGGIAARRHSLGILVRSRAGAWSPKDDALMGTIPDAALAKKINRTFQAVKSRRRQKGIPPATPPARLWTAAEDAIVRRFPPAEAAKRLERSLSAIEHHRRRVLRIGTRRRPPSWSPQEDALLGAMPDAQLAKKLNRTFEAVRVRRKKKRILVNQGGIGSGHERLALNARDG